MWWIVSKKFVRLAFALVCWLGLPSLAISASDIQVPAAQGYVNDFAGVLQPEESKQLAAISASLEQATGAEMVFLIMPTIQPYDDFTYGMAVFDQWKIGKKGKDNGLLVLLALQERRLRIVTGYGLEPILPDGKLGRYRDEYLVPWLKQNRPGEGLANIGLAIAQEIAKAQGVSLTGAAHQAPKRGRGNSETLPAFILIGVILLIGLILDQINRYRIRRYGVPLSFGGTTTYRSGGGGFGGGFGGFGGGFSGGGGVGGSW